MYEYLQGKQVKQRFDQCKQFSRDVPNKTLIALHVTAIYSDSSICSRVISDKFKGTREHAHIYTQYIIKYTHEHAHICIKIQYCSWPCSNTYQKVPGDNQHAAVHTPVWSSLSGYGHTTEYQNPVCSWTGSYIRFDEVRYLDSHKLPWLYKVYWNWVSFIPTYRCG